MLGVFASVVPVGVAIGMIITSTTGVQSLISGLLGAFASGSFLYVALLGIIVEEFAGFDNLWRKFFCVIGGVFFMGIVSAITETAL